MLSFGGGVVAKKKQSKAESEETEAAGTAVATKKRGKKGDEAKDAAEEAAREVEAEETEGAAEGEDAAPVDIKEELKKVLGVEVEDAGTLRKRLTITIPAETIKEERDKQYSDLIREAVIPGFRRGRAPRRLVEKRFASEVGDQVQTKLVTNAYMAATEMKELKVLGDPQFWMKDKDGEEKLVDVETALKKMKLPDEGALTYRAELEIWPQFELPELKKIKVKRPKVKITPEDVNKQLDRLRSMRGTWEPVEKGKAEKDDVLICDVRMTVDGAEIKKEENVRLAARAQRVEGVTLEKLGEVLVGAKPGDHKKIEGTIPDDYEKAELRGKTAKFEITVHELKRFALPPVDATFLQSVGFESEKELKEYLKGQMEKELDATVKRGMHSQVQKYLLEKTKIDLPEGLSRRHVDRAIIRKIVELRRDGVPQEEIEKHADELRTGATQQAIDGLKLHFLFDDIAEKLGVEVTEEEVNGQIAAIARRYNRRFDRVRDELAQSDGLTALYLEIRDDKCLDKLLEDAEIEETKGPAESVSDVVEST